MSDAQVTLADTMSDAQVTLADTIEDTATSAAQLAAERVAAINLEQQRTDAFSTLRSLLNRVGLGELESAVQGVITSGRVSLTDPSAIMFALRDQPAYQKRFAANKKRIENGLPELDPTTYVAMEQEYRKTLAANGLPLNFYNDQTDFEKFIEGNVSVSELQARITDGYKKVANADPAVVAKLRELYDIGGGDLAAYFIDPQRVRPSLVAADYKRQAQAAAIAARGGEVGVELGREDAEGLARRGVTEQQAESKFLERGQLAGLFEEMTGEQGMSEEEKLGATFGYDVGAANRLKKRAATRRSVFQGGGGFARTSGATSGTIETGLSESQ
jgi:hypothetical protein